MDEASFKRDRAAQGYGDFNVKEWSPGTVNEMHTHEFGASVLVLSGEITVTTGDGQATTCQPGDTFSLDAGIPHEEKIGPDGVRFLSGRK